MGIGIRHHASTNLENPVLPLAGHHPKVALQSESQSDPDGMAVDRRDHGFPHLPRRRIYASGAEFISALLEGRTATAEVGPSAKSAARTRHDYNANRVVPIALPIRVTQFHAHRPGECIELLGSVEGDDRDRFANVEGECPVFHECVFPGGWPIRPVDPLYIRCHGVVTIELGLSRRIIEGANKNE